MKLSELEHSKIRLQQKVRSAVGTPGVVTKTIEYCNTFFGIDEVEITWGTQAVSKFWHRCCDLIDIVEEDKNDA